MTQKDAIIHLQACALLLYVQKCFIYDICNIFCILALKLFFCSIFHSWSISSKGSVSYKMKWQKYLWFYHSQLWPKSAPLISIWHIFNLALHCCAGRIPVTNCPGPRNRGQCCRRPLPPQGGSTRHTDLGSEVSAPSWNSPLLPGLTR